MKLLRVAGRRAGWALAVAAVLALGACSNRQERPRAQTAASPQRPVQKAAASEDLWHLRIGLNVAALSCRGRGREPVAGAYRQVLSRHASLLKAAYDGEQKRYGQSGYDSHATKLYNRFANQRSAARFCSEAARVARRAGSIDSVAFAQEASSMLGQLKRWAG
jgi:hypothetical protein